MASFHITIPTPFDPSTLPAWAQRYPAVVALARRDLGYRCDLANGRSSAVWRHKLRDEAEKRMGETR